MNSKSELHLEDLLESLRRHAAIIYTGPHKLFSAWDRLLLIGSAGSYLTSFSLVLIGKDHLQRSRALGMSFLILYCLATLLAIAVPLRQLILSWKDLSQPVSSLLKHRSAVILHDRKLLQQLRQMPRSELSFLSDRLQLEADHLRSRVGLLVGGIDKVGTVPLVIGAIVSGWKFLHEKQLAPGLLEIAVAGVAFLYLVGVIFTLTSHRLDELAHLIRAAEASMDRIDV